MRGIVVLSLFLVQSFILQAQASRFKRLESKSLEAQAGDELVVSGIQGQLRLYQHKGSKVQVEARYRPSGSLSWSYTLSRVGKQIFIRVVGPSSRTDWQEILKKGASDFQLKVTVPAMPVSVSWKKGTLELLSWKSRASIALSSGELVVKNMEGKLSANVDEGQIFVDGLKGSSQLQSYNATAKLSRLDGPVELSNFFGKSYLNKVTGDISFHSFSGLLHSKITQGQIEFKQSRGHLQINQHDGSLRGELEEGGKLEAQLKGKVHSVRLRAKSGDISLVLPRRQGANIYLRSEKGRVLGPKSLSSKRTSAGRVLHGRRPGRGSGTVNIITQSANIKVR